MHNEKYWIKSVRYLSLLGTWQNWLKFSSVVQWQILVIQYLFSSKSRGKLEIFIDSIEQNVLNNSAIKRIHVSKSLKCCFSFLRYTFFWKFTWGLVVLIFTSEILHPLGVPPHPLIPLLFFSKEKRKNKKKKSSSYLYADLFLPTYCYSLKLSLQVSNRISRWKQKDLHPKVTKRPLIMKVNINSRPRFKFF